MKKADVIIVGAGAAGLMAARELSRSGKKVHVLEARDRICGRIHPLSVEDFGYEAQGGGEFVHGEAPITTALVKEAGLTFTNPTEWWNVLDGEPSKEYPHVLHEPQLKKALKQLTEDMTVVEFLEKYFSGDTYAQLRDYVWRRTEGYDAADPRRASAFALRDEMSDESSWQQRNLKEGYGALLRYLEKEIRRYGSDIQLNKEVVSVDFSQKDVSVGSTDGSTCVAEKILITVPLPLIETITFTPEIREKFAAVKKLGYGNVIKILIRFKTRWWAAVRQKIFERLFFMFSDERIPTWWTQYPTRHPVLTGWVTAAKADALCSESDEKIIEVALQSLASIFSISVEELRSELVHYYVANWPKDPYARGAYSYRTPQSDEGIAELSKPVDGKLFFAGEALAPQGSFATVEGAFASGISAAKGIPD